MVNFLKSGSCILIFSGSNVQYLLFLKIINLFLLQVIYSTNITSIFCQLPNCVEFWRNSNRINIMQLWHLKPFFNLDLSDLCRAKHSSTFSAFYKSSKAQQSSYHRVPDPLRSNTSISSQYNFQNFPTLTLQLVPNYFHISMLW